MCGIAGTIVFEATPGEVDAGLLERMRDTLAHRGPDGAGLWISPNRRVGLAHRRLAIIDLAPEAAQPLANHDGSLQLVFNGEIYNHVELRRQLTGLGQRAWRTDHSDSEVILHAYARWGIDALPRLRGMFAFALWDARLRQLWLARDRLGIKPLYYTVRDGRLSFASEIKALLADPQQPRAIDEEALFHYLSFLTTPAPATLFAGIHKLPAATWVRVTHTGETRSQRWWEVWDNTEPLVEVSPDSIADRVREELRSAVKLHKVSDVPVGVFLSGGLDSSTNAVLFSEGATEPVHTFSIGYEGHYKSYPDELPYAAMVAAKIGARHDVRRLTVDDVVDFIPRLAYLQDEPIADPVCIPLYYLSALARAGDVRVCQVGEGADELFCGYRRWSAFLAFQKASDLPVPRALRRLGLTGMRAMGLGLSTAYELARRGAEQQPLFWGGAEAFSHSQKLALLAPRLRKRFRCRSSWEVIEPIWARFQKQAWEKTTLNWMSHIDLNLRLPELLLMRVDKMSMAVGLETRVPFLDHHFVELALSIPTAVRIAGGERKHILKRAVAPLLPDEIVRRRKVGFGMPLHEWSLTRLSAAIRPALREFCSKTDLLDADAVDHLVTSSRDPRPVWYLYNLALWWKQFF